MNTSNDTNKLFSDEISIKIRSIDKEFMVEIRTQDNIERLKEKIENVLILFYHFSRFQKYQQVGRDLFFAGSSSKIMTL